MKDRPGLRHRILSWSERKAPPFHRFLTHDGFGWSASRTAVSLGLLLALGTGLLWGLTGQPLDEPPVVVIESGSMMHCANGVDHHGDDCESSSWGRLGTIDTGDLVFVRNVKDRGDISTFVSAQDHGGAEHHGRPGDVIVYLRPDQPPIIHRAMFWVDIHDNGTYSIPELGIDHATTTNRPEIDDPERFGLKSHGCRLDLPLQFGPAASGFVTKGDNNACWDQQLGSQFSLGVRGPIPVDQIVGKARGEVPWIGLLKLLVFDIIAGSGNYGAAPGDLKGFMWGSVVLLVTVPYGVEWLLRRRAAGSAASQAKAAAPGAPPGPTTHAKDTAGPEGVGPDGTGPDAAKVSDPSEQE